MLGETGALLNTDIGRARGTAKYRRRERHEDININIDVRVDGDGVTDKQRRLDNHESKNQSNDKQEEILIYPESNSVC